MLVAQDENGKVVNLLEMNKIPRFGKFFCPACRSKLILKQGEIKIPHFAHLSKKNCDSWSENESLQHLTLKKKLYQWFSSSSEVESLELEYYLPELNQTPDLLVNQKIAIEIQCSSLSLQRLWERTKNYQEWGYTVLWLLGKSLWLKDSLTELQKNLMYFSENRGFFLWELDLEREELRLKSLIHEHLSGKVQHLTEKFDFCQGNLLEILRQPFRQQKLPSIAVQSDLNQLHFVKTQLFYRTQKWLKLQEKYYQKGKNLLLEDFEVPYVSPPGLNLLEVKLDGISSVKFCQIGQDLQKYYHNYYYFFEKVGIQVLYPPAFYAIMKSKIKEKEERNKER